MEPHITTPRLSLFLQTSSDLGGPDVRDYTTLRSDPGAMLWTFEEPSSDPDETQRVLIKNHLPPTDCRDTNDPRKYRASYSIYSWPATDSDEPHDVKTRDSSRFIGRVGASEPREYGPGVDFASDLIDSAYQASDKSGDVVHKSKILPIEIGYSLLESAWGHGYASEALAALLGSYTETYSARLGPPFEQSPYDKLVFMAIVGEPNHASIRVLKRCGFTREKLHRFDGPDVFIGGQMRPPEVFVYALGPVDGRK